MNWGLLIKYRLIFITLISLCLSGCIRLEKKTGQCIAYAGDTFSHYRKKEVPVRQMLGMVLVDGNYAAHTWVEYYNEEWRVDDRAMGYKGFPRESYTTDGKPDYKKLDKYDEIKIINKYKE